LNTLALVESPVQILNVLEWAHSIRVGSASAATPPDLTLAVLSPNDPMSRGQLRRMTEFARDEGIAVRWCEARSSKGALLNTAAKLAPQIRSARRLVLGDPFSRLVQTLLPLNRARDVVVVDDGTATMEFVQLLERGGPLVRWHRSGARPGPGTALAALARRRLAPSRRRTLEIFTSMTVPAVDGLDVTPNRLDWTRSRLGPPRISAGTDIVGTSLVETGVVIADRYQDAVATLARVHGATRYFAHRRESADKLRQLAAATGLEIVRPDLPLELVARRGPVGHTILSFPSTVVHTLPLALEGTGVKVTICDIDPTWLTTSASPRAQGFLSGITGTARLRHGLASVAWAGPAPSAN
jgi:hypothetical protein